MVQWHIFNFFANGKHFVVIGTGDRTRLVLYQISKSQKVKGFLKSWLLFGTAIFNGVVHIRHAQGPLNVSKRKHLKTTQLEFNPLLYFYNTFSLNTVNKKQDRSCSGCTDDTRWFRSLMFSYVGYLLYFWLSRGKTLSAYCKLCYNVQITFPLCFHLFH